MKTKHLSLVLAIAVLLLFPAQGKTDVASDIIDFEGLAEGMIVSSVNGAGGTGPIMVNGLNPDFPANNAAMIFDSDCLPGGAPANCSGDDPDLGSPNEDFGGPGSGLGGESGMPFQNDVALHNVLIISEDLNGADPDDADVFGAMFTFDFTQITNPFTPDGVTIFSVTIMDVDGNEADATVTLFDPNGFPLGNFPIGNLGDNGVTTVETGPTGIGTSGVGFMGIVLNGSGAVDNIVFEAYRGERCRTGGFYGSHAGIKEKDNPQNPSQNITQAIINAGGPLTICGETISNTLVNDDMSALEAICVSPKGNDDLQNVRQLTVASLNCIMSDSSHDCSSASIAGLFAACNANCAGGNGPLDAEDCRDRLDCFNNGGITIANGKNFCKTGTCSDNLAPCNDDKKGLKYCDDPKTATCVPLDGSCHDRELCTDGLCFVPPGPAGSSKQCNEAIKNKCTVISPDDAFCGLMAVNKKAGKTKAQKVKKQKNK